MKATSKVKERKWYILSKNSQFEECSIVPLDINGSLAGISGFGEDIVSEVGSASGGISTHDGSKNDTDSGYNTEPSIISTTTTTTTTSILFTHKCIIFKNAVIDFKWVLTT